MPSLSHSNTSQIFNWRVKYSYLDTNGKSYENFIDIETKSNNQPTPQKVSACVASRWKSKKYNEGLFHSIEIIDIQ